MTKPSLSLSLEMQKKAARLGIREPEQVGKGKAYGFVTEGKSEYDVELTWDPDTGQNVKGKCECGSSDSFCIHKAALLTWLSDDPKKSKSLKKSGPKSKPLDLILDGISLEEIRPWLTTKLQESPLLAAEFVMKFTPKVTRELVDRESIAKALAEGIQILTGGKKRKITGAEGESLEGYWDEIEAPILQALKENPKGKKELRLAYLLLEELEAIKESAILKASLIEEHIWKVQAEIIQRMGVIMNSSEAASAIRTFFEIPSETKMKHGRPIWEISFLEPFICNLNDGDALAILDILLKESSQAEDKTTNAGFMKSRELLEILSNFPGHQWNLIEIFPFVPNQPDYNLNLAYEFLENGYCKELKVRLLEPDIRKGFFSVEDLLQLLESIEVEERSILKRLNKRR